MAPQKAITIECKLAVFKDLDAGMKQSDVVKKYGLSQSTVATFVKRVMHAVIIRNLLT